MHSDLLAVRSINFVQIDSCNTVVGNKTEEHFKRPSILSPAHKQNLWQAPILLHLEVYYLAIFKVLNKKSIPIFDVSCVAYRILL